MLGLLQICYRTKYKTVDWKGKKKLIEEEESGAYPKVIIEHRTNKLQFDANTWKTRYIIVCKSE